MPAPKFEDLIAEMEEAGVDPAFIDKAKEAFAASPLRKELADTKAEVAAAIERAQKAESGLLTTTFKELGITAKPTAFNLPDDLDRLDPEAVRGWAVDQGLIAAPEANATDENLDALDRIAAASVGAGASSAADPGAALLNPNLSRDEFYAQAKATGFAS